MSFRTILVVTAVTVLGCVSAPAQRERTAGDDAREIRERVVGQWGPQYFEEADRDWAREELEWAREEENWRARDADWRRRERENREWSVLQHPDYNGDRRRAEAELRERQRRWQEDEREWAMARSERDTRQRRWREREEAHRRWLEARRVGGDEQRLRE